MPWFEILCEEPLDGFQSVDKHIYSQVLEFDDDDAELYDCLIEVGAIECFGPYVTEAQAREGTGFR